ncbi:MAG: molybdopterin molybdotransferase MoeA [Armatimonadota bacterium]
MISVEEAQAKVLEEVRPLGVEAVDLAQCLGRVLAQNLVAPHDLPPFDNSAMDGYALRVEDTALASPNTPVRLKIVGESSAGRGYPAQLQPMEAVVINTGAPVPVGANTVLPLEQAQLEAGYLLFETSIKAGMNIRPKGLDVRKDTPVLEAGTRLQLQPMGLLAALGLSPLQVYRRPRVAILVTGSELLPYNAPLRPDAIRDSNSLILHLWLESRGIPHTFIGTAPDDLPATIRLLERAFQEADLVLLTGGVSVGERDVVKPALQDLGVDTVFWRVNMKPGKPILFAMHRHQAVFGLPGNPLAVVVGLLVFFLPYLSALEGETQPLPRYVMARLGTPVYKKESRAEFQTARLCVLADGSLSVTPTPAQGSALLGSLAQANAFIYLPPGESAYPEGTLVKVLPIAPLEGCA